MKREDLHMDEALLKQYITGDLNHTEMHFVEHQLQENEMWQDVHDGMLAMQEKGISINDEVQSLQEELFKTVKPKAKRIKIAPWRYAAAAALIGVLVAGTYLVFNNIGPKSEVANLSKPAVQLEDLDIIEVITIGDSEENNVVNRSFDESKIEALTPSEVLEAELDDEARLVAEIDNIITSTKKLRPRKSETLTAYADHTYIKQRGYYELYALPTDRQVRSRSGPSAPLTVPLPRQTEPQLVYSLPQENTFAQVTPKKAVVIKGNSSITATRNTEVVKVTKTDSIHSIEEELTRKAAGIEVVDANKSRRVFKGKVLDDLGQPIIGAAVRIKNTSIGAITNADGEFELASATLNDELIISYIGYEAITAQVLPIDDLAYQLKQDELATDQVVITALGTNHVKQTYGSTTQEIEGKDIDTTIEKKQEDAALEEVTNSSSSKTKLKNKRKKPVPLMGWNDYQKYLQWRIEEGGPWIEKGTVILNAIVTSTGHIKELQLVKSLNKSQDAAAIQYINEGGSWLPVIKDRQAQQGVVEIRVEF